jgi:hypothetical protein
MRQLIKRALQLTTVSVALFGIAVTAPVQAAMSQTHVVSQIPASTPNIVLGTGGETVYAYAQIGNTMYAGGKFHRVLSPARTTSYDRQNFVAFNASNGQLTDLSIDFNNTVQAVVAVPGQQALYIAGNFTYVNGTYAPYLIRYDLANNKIDPTFQPSLNGPVSDMQLNYYQQLIVAGTFTKYLVALDKTTGKDTGLINLSISGKVNPDDVTKIRRFGISPKATKIVALGNFTSINGASRRQAFMLDMTSTTAKLSPWDPPEYHLPCHENIAPFYARGVDFSPDGQYFVIANTGGPHGNGLGPCDSAVRFETHTETNTVQHTWINYTGGDSLYSVAITGAAVYVGGHMRWLDNPWGYGDAGPGAVSRNGIGAIDPTSGKALSWNPGKTRGHGTERLFVTPNGLWIGSDGELLAGYYRAGIGFLPL